MVILLGDDCCKQAFTLKNPVEDPWCWSLPMTVPVKFDLGRVGGDGADVCDVVALF